MKLIDRAGRFVKGGKPSELLPLLGDCVADGGSEAMLAVKLLARDMYGGMTFNTELKIPSAYCLFAWGTDGVRAMSLNALEEPTLKNYSLAFTLLSSVTEGHEPPSIGTWLHDDELRLAVSSAVGDWNRLAGSARSHLHELMLSIERDDDAGLYVSNSLNGLVFQDSSAIRSLSNALALRSIAVGPRVLAAYDELVTEESDNESVFQHFFEENPLMLDPRAFQVWGQPDFHGRLKPDFVIRTYDNNYVIVEIETPAKLLVTRQNQLSADATHAVGQVIAYREYLRTHLAAASEVFPGFAPPSGLVVVGRESSLNADQKAVLRAENQTRRILILLVLMHWLPLPPPLREM